jgi:actin cytoskeleton-regulatory complex protein PAN1
MVSAEFNTPLPHFSFTLFRSIEHRLKIFLSFPCFLYASHNSIQIDDHEDAHQASRSLASPTKRPLESLSATADSSLRSSVNLDHSESDSEEYVSFYSGSEVADEAQPRTPLSESGQQAEHEAREKERQRVLEAAGLIVKVDNNERHPPPPPLPILRRKSTRNKRRAPERPPRKIQTPETPPTRAERDLPDIPSSPVESITQVDDAFERYESFKKAGNRLSVASIEAMPSPPSATSGFGQITPSVSKEGESPVTGRSHGLFNFLGRGAPDRRPSPGISTSTISAPVMSGASSSEPLAESTSSFGTVRDNLGCLVNQN